MSGHAIKINQLITAKSLKGFLFIIIKTKQGSSFWSFIRIYLLFLQEQNMSQGHFLM